MLAAAHVFLLHHFIFICHMNGVFPRKEVVFIFLPLLDEVLSAATVPSSVVIDGKIVV